MSVPTIAAKHIVSDSPSSAWVGPKSRHIWNDAASGTSGACYLSLELVDTFVISGVPPVIVGVAGYTGPLTGDGVVEIAYGIAPHYQKRGLAT
jgi:RimJ/RimL family protein N-acetyltransferase